jgi:histidinol-phosphate/aromatic aminotransferase/cobyric acid decarboxylase-like protein/GNAT superfamily N-acetyltransferase
MTTRTDSRPDQSTTTLEAGQSLRFQISEATGADRETIFGIRHEVYARELGQHMPNGANRLRDALDDVNVYLVIHVDGEVAGFVSVTPPGEHSYSIDKYFDRDSLSIPFDDKLYEVRLLTVLKPHRGREAATLLMYAAFRWVESHGGSHVVAIGRREILDLYRRAGLDTCGRGVQSGAVHYELLQAPVSALRERAEEYPELLDRLEKKTEWRLNFPFRRPASCFHGGASFRAIGEGFQTIDRRHGIINADVLDAWFPPSPKVLSAFRDHLPWLLSTSPPTGCEGLTEAIAHVRGVATESVLPGAGSSDLIFRALRHWLTPRSSVLILDPTYGEYAHVLEQVIGCRVDRLPLRRADDYQLSLPRLEAMLEQGPDLVVIVNPNSPTGRHVPRSGLEAFLRRVPPRTRVWVDETYVEYAGAGESLERIASKSENVVVCKSMSKVYALSGVRVAYLCAGPHQLEALRAITPPWSVSLPAQVAAVRALEDAEYYADRYAETAVLRDRLADQLRELNWDVLPGIANFLLSHLPEDGPDAATLVQACREQGLYLRDAAAMGSKLGRNTVRIAVKDASTNERMVRIIAEAVGQWHGSEKAAGRPG